MKHQGIPRVVGKLFVPPILLFALYVQFHGDFGPGGGFQAGVIFAAAVVLYTLIFGLQAAKQIVKPRIVETLIALGVLLYAGTGLVSLFLGRNFSGLQRTGSGQYSTRTTLGHLSGRTRRGDYRGCRNDSDLFCFCRSEAIAMISVGLFNYWACIVLMMIGLYTVIARPNLIKKLIGLSIFQVSVFLLYISMGKVSGGTAPILGEGIETYSNPLPHVLILTAIVVGIATLSLGLALVVRIGEAYDTIEEDEIIEQDLVND